MNTTARDLARHYASLGLGTADELPPLPSGEDAWGTVLDALKLTDEQLRIFKKMKPHALCLVGTSGPISATLMTPAGHVTKRLGHNRGCWPMRSALSGSHKDTITATYDKAAAWRTGVQVRLWLDSEEHARRLALEVGDLLGHMAREAMGTPMLNGFHDVGPDLQMEMLEGDIVEKARRRGWHCRTDDELVAWLERLRREDQLLERIEGR